MSTEVIMKNNNRNANKHCELKKRKERGKKREKLEWGEEGRAIEGD